jgi:VWFA-related protein
MLAALILTMGLATFSNPQDQKQKILRHDAAAVVKLVPVRILNAEGGPVRGLTRQDFVLFDNGEIKKITEFEVHESRENRAASVELQSAGEPAQSASKRKFFFVLDMQGSDLFGNRDAKKAVLQFVDNNLELGDEAGVLTFGAQTGLLLRQYLTSDLTKIKKAISRSIEMPGGTGRLEGTAITTSQGRAQERAASEIGAEEYASDTMPFGYGDNGIGVEAPAGLPPGTARTRTDFDRSMSELAKAMGYVPGSKNVVYFSTRTPGKAVGRLFAAANATVFTVNTNSVSTKGPGLQKKRKEQQGEALKDLAETSGGCYFSDVKDAKKIAADIEALSSNYYVLGYYINPSWDGRQHEIKVTVQRPDLKVLVQESYNDPKPFAELSDLEKKLQLFDMLLSDAPVGTDVLDLPVRVLDGPAMKEANAVALMKLTVDERTGVPPGTTEIFVFLFDGDHKIVLGERAKLDTRALAHKTLFPYFLVQLPPGEYECRVAARDMDTGQSVASRTPFSVPASGRRHASSLSSPLLLIPSGKAEFVRMSRPLKKGKKPASILRFYPYLPVRCAPLLEDIPEDAEQIWALLPLKSGTGQPAKTDLDVRLIRTVDRKNIAFDWSVLDTRRLEPDMTFFLIRIDVRHLGSGRYLLEFQVVDPSSGGNTSTASALVKK